MESFGAWGAFDEAEAGLQKVSPSWRGASQAKYEGHISGHLHVSPLARM